MANADRLRGTHIASTGQVTAQLVDGPSLPGARSGADTLAATESPAERGLLYALVCGSAAGIGFRDAACLAALFDHDVTRVDLDRGLYGRFLMAWEHDEPARIGSDACVLPDRELQHSTAIHADTLAYEGVRRLSVAWALKLDPFVDTPCQGLVLRHPTFALIVHSLDPSTRVGDLHRY
jgi:hypothetical protein